jgi:hypothetical protein
VVVSITGGTFSGPKLNGKHKDPTNFLSTGPRVETYIFRQSLPGTSFEPDRF